MELLLMEIGGSPCTYSAVLYGGQVELFLFLNMDALHLPDNIMQNAAGLNY